MDFIGWAISGVLFLNIIFIFFLIFYEKKGPASTWAWVLILSLLPLVGFLLYLFLGVTPRKRRIFREKAKKDLEKKRSLIKGAPDYKVWKVPEEYKDKIIQINFSHDQIVFSKNNKIDIYTTGHDKFRALFHSIKKAEHHIHLSYYIVRNDKLTQALMNLLTKKAKEGLKVRLIYDSIGGRELPRGYFDEFKRAGGMVTKFFPSLLDLNNRNHRKIVVIDGKVGFVGGFNIGKEYLGFNKKFGFWRDTHIKITGEAAKSLQERFLLDWNFASNEDIILHPLYYPSLPYYGRSGVQIVASGPDSSWEEIKVFLLKMVYMAKDFIYIQTPYFIPDESLLEALKIASISGVDVRIMIPNKPDHLFVYSANHCFGGIMLEAGARWYMYQKGFLHSKVMIADNKVATVGTSNMDVRSFKLNFEINSFIYDPYISIKLKKIFFEDLKYCKEITRDIYEQRGTIMKAKESISYMISPIL